MPSKSTKGKTKDTDIDDTKKVEKKEKVALRTVTARQDKKVKDEDNESSTTKTEIKSSGDKEVKRKPSKKDEVKSKKKRVDKGNNSDDEEVKSPKSKPLKSPTTRSGKNKKKSADISDEDFQDDITISDDERNIKLSGKKSTVSSKLKKNSSETKEGDFTIKVKKNDLDKTYIFQDVSKISDINRKKKETEKKSKKKNDDQKGLLSRISGLGLSTLANLPDSQISDKNLVNVKIIYNMKDQATGRYLPPTIDLPCRNCRRHYKTQPFGIPIKYNPSKVRSRYFSVLNPTTECESVRHLSFAESMKILKSKLKGGNTTDVLEINDYFDTLYFFCNIPCVLRYAHDNRHIRRFTESPSLIRMMIKRFPDQNQIMGQGIKGMVNKIGTAPPLDLLIDNGGKMNIDEYHNITNQVEPFIIFFDPIFTRPSNFHTREERYSVLDAVNNTGEEIKDEEIKEEIEKEINKNLTEEEKQYVKENRESSTEGKSPISTLKRKISEGKDIKNDDDQDVDKKVEEVKKEMKRRSCRPSTTIVEQMEENIKILKR